MPKKGATRRKAAKGKTAGNTARASRGADVRNSAQSATKPEAPATPVQLAPPSPLTGYQLPVGAHPGNTGGKAGRSGRPKKAFKAFVAELRQDPDVQDALGRAAKNENAKNFKAALDVIVRYDTDAPENDPLAGLSKEQLTERIVNILKVAAKRRKEATGNRKTG